MKEGLGFSTKAVHAGELADYSAFKPVATPIYTSVAYTYENTGTLDAVYRHEVEGFIYSRHGNPTVAAIEKAVAALEGGEGAMAFASGMAAIHGAILSLGLKAGDKIVASRDVYGAVYTLLATYYGDLGVRTTFVDITDLANLQEVVSSQKPRCVILEVISNPLLRVADVPAIVQLAHANGAKVLVDNTFTTPYLLNPIGLGADMVIHSITKFISGHDDVLGGMVVSSEETCRILLETLRASGGALGPFQAYLALRGLKTLPLRMAKHCANALEVAKWLEGDRRVAKVNYPGLASHPQHEVAKRILKPQGFGGMVSFELANGNREMVFKFLDSLEVCVPATTLGDVYSLILYPTMSSHRALTPEQRQAVGIGEGLVRMSVGIEDVDDIIADLDQALGKAQE